MTTAFGCKTTLTGKGNNKEVALKGTKFLRLIFGKIQSAKLISKFAHHCVLQIVFVQTKKTTRVQTRKSKNLFQVGAKILQTGTVDVKNEGKHATHKHLRTDKATPQTKKYTNNVKHHAGLAIITN